MTKALLIGVMCGALLGFVVGITVVRCPRCDFTELLRSVGEVEARCEQLAASRCMNVTTPVLNVTVYDAPNLGVKRP